MEISKIKPSLENVAGSKVMILQSVQPSYTYENGHKTDNQDGWSCDFVCLDNGYEKLRCKVISKIPISQEMIEASESPIKCTLDGFECKIYRDFKNNTYAISCKAKALIIMK